MAVSVCKILVQRQPIHGGLIQSADAVHRAGIANQRVDELLLRVGIPRRDQVGAISKRCNRSRQGIGAPIADSGQDQVVSRDATGDPARRTERNGLPEHFPSNAAHADFVAAIGDADRLHVRAAARRRPRTTGESARCRNRSHRRACYGIGRDARAERRVRIRPRAPARRELARPATGGYGLAPRARSKSDATSDPRGDVRNASIQRCEDCPSHSIGNSNSSAASSPQQRRPASSNGRP